MCDWGEGDAVVYLQMAGDLHMVAGETKFILSFLIAGPKSLNELVACVESSGAKNTERGFLQRHLFQLEALGLIHKARKTP